MKRTVTIVVLFLVVLSACGADDEGGETYGSGSGDERTVAGGGLPDDFPEDFPLPDGAEFMSATDGTFNFEVTESPEELAETFAARLDGWEIDGTGDELADTEVLDMGFTGTYDGGKVTAATGEDGSILAVTIDG